MAGFTAGLVEGFYGRQWSWQARFDMAGFLAQHGFSEYLYCPKNDDNLRKYWQENWPAETLVQLKQLASYCRSSNVLFSVGLSPLGFVSSNDIGMLLNRVEQLVELGFSKLYLLFDDMKGGDPGLAGRQIDIIERVAINFPGLALGMCPSYYSDDPILDKIFGERPDNYLQDLGQGLAKEISVFWTGEHVCSKSYSLEHLKNVAERLQRKPLLWDNYSVNDGKKLCDFLFLQPPSFRPTEMYDLLEGCFSNPMNQAYLSQIPLHGLAAMYQGQASSDHFYSLALQQLCPKLEHLLMRDKELFGELGLSQIPHQQRLQLISEYKAADQSPFVDELAAWLSDEYRFDPACLT